MTELDRRGFVIAGASVAAAPLLAAASPAGQGGVFGGMSQDELDRAYDQRPWASNAADVQARYIATSAEITRRMPPVAQRYGPGAHQLVDIFAPPGARGAPVFVIIHGGAWRLAMREAHYGPVPAIVAAGCVGVVVGFDCIPAVSLSAMAAQIRAALGWIRGNVARFGGDGGNVRLIGHSSGAHLAAVMLTTTTTGLRGGALLGGVFELYPVMLSSRRDYLKLDDADVAALSPMRHLDRVSGRLIVASGTAESPEFRRQASVFAGALQGMGRLDRAFTIPGCNHFELFEQLNDAKTPLMAAVLANARS